MLQRQIMFKQLQELQRRQQLQELGDARSQDYVDQLSSLKQASAVQFAPKFNGAPIHDSQMFMDGNAKMIQHGGSSIFQGFSDESVHSQSLNHTSGPMGLSQPQFDVSLYGTPAPNTERNLNPYSHFQGPSNHPANPWSKNNNSPLGMSSMHPSAFASSFTSRQGNFSSEQISMPDESLLPNRVFQEKNLFGQVPVESLERNLLSLNYSQQGISMQRTTPRLESEGRHGDTGWLGISPGKVSKVGISQPAASLDALEEKILYNTEDNSWESSFGRNSKMGTGGFDCTAENPSYMDTLPSIQSGSWSAMMQSAVTETSSSDTVMQEEWSGVSFQNPDPSSDNQPSSFINSEKPHNNWVDRNLQNVSSPSSEPEQLFQKSNMNYSYPSFKQSEYQYLIQKDEFQSESFHASVQHSPRNTSQLTDYNSQPKHSTGGCQLVQTPLPSTNTWPAQYKKSLQNDAYQPTALSCTNDKKPNINFSGHEVRDTLWLHGNTSNSVSSGIQSGNMLELLNKDDISNDSTPEMQLTSKVSSPNQLPLIETPVASFAKPCNTRNLESQGFGFRLGPADAGTTHSHSFFPSLSMGNTSATSLSSSKPPAYSAAFSQVDLQSKSANSDDLEFPHVEPSGKAVVSQHVRFPTGLTTSWSNINSQQDMCSSRPNRFSAGLFRFPDSASSSLETSSGAPNEQPNQNRFKHELNVQEFGIQMGRSGYNEQRMEKESYFPEGPTEMHNPTLSRNIHAQESLRKYHSEADDFVSGSLATSTSRQPSNQAEQKGNKTPAIDIRAFGHSLHQNYSQLHQQHSPRNAETDCGKNLPLKYDITNYQAMANARDLLLREQKSVTQDKVKSDLGATPVGPFYFGNNMGWNLLQEPQEDRPGKASSATNLQNFQQVEMFSQNAIQNHLIGSNEVSNVAYQSQISSQMSPSWSKHYAALKNGLNIANLQENSLNMQVNSANTSQGSGIWPSSAVALIASKHLSPSSTLPSDITHLNLALSKPIKRKIVAFDMVPWHKEVNHEELRLQNISTAESEWAQASNRREEEAKNEAEIIEDMPPVIRAKRRLISITQLMQQVFRPAAAVILFADASSNYDNVVYSAARLALGDACNLTSKVAPDTTDASTDKLSTSKRTSACDFSKVVEGLITRVQKLEGDLSRLDQNLSIVDIKVESQELEKISTINRFGKFHIKANPSTVDSTSCSGPSTVPKTIPQRYVMAHPLPRTLPEGVDYLSL